MKNTLLATALFVLPFLAFSQTEKPASASARPACQALAGRKTRKAGKLRRVKA
ncbi:MAG: hypothetical protein IPH31_11195 [Lewinellaceae bacterium]|nr:hypothetical protein [Lewinellaceae bacterium]